MCIRKLLKQIRNMTQKIKVNMIFYILNKLFHHLIN